MPTNQPIYLYLNELLVDETWIAIKRDGIPAERITQATANAKAKTTFGLGNIWTWLAADLKAEVSVEGSGAWSQKFTQTAFLRAILLPELLGGTTEQPLDGNTLKNLSIGTFLNLACDESLLVHIPTLADVVRNELLEQMIEKAANEANSAEGGSASIVPLANKLELMTALIDKRTASRKGVAFDKLLHDEKGFPTFLWHLYSNFLKSEFMNAMCMSNDDQVLLLSTLTNVKPHSVVIAFLEEKNLRRNLAGYTGDRPVQIFGKLASRREIRGSSEFIIGIDAISIALA